MASLVLVVDDQDIVRKTLARALERLGYEPVEAASGEAALARIAEQPGAFACMVIDRVMPGLSGTQLIRRIREQDPDVPIVLTTGFHDVEQLPEEKISCVLSKPWTAEEVGAAMQKALGPGAKPTDGQCGPPSGGSN